MTPSRLILLLATLLLIGCDGLAGGGGSLSVPPADIPYAHPTTLQLELSVWGAGSGKMSRRYTNIRCHYKAENAPAFTPIEGQVVSESQKRLTLQFDLPPFTSTDGAYVEYYFDMSFDGHYNKRDIQRVPFK